MSKVSSNYSRESGKTPAASSKRPAPNKVSRPGWIEIVVSLVVLVVVGFGIGSQLGRFELDLVFYGLVFTALSGIAGIAGFAAAALVRIRSLSAFGVRRVSGRWMLIGVGAGLVAFVLKGDMGWSEWHWQGKHINSTELNGTKKSRNTCGLSSL